LEVLFIRELAELCCPLSLTGSRVGVGEAFDLGPDECIWFDEEALTLVTLPAATPFQHYRPERGVFLRTACECSAATWQKLQMVEVSAGETESLPFVERLDPRPATEVLVAVSADWSACGDEHSQVVMFGHA
jgi:hypothetical protein